MRRWNARLNDIIRRVDILEAIPHYCVSDFKELTSDIKAIEQSLSEKAGKDEIANAVSEYFGVPARRRAAYMDYDENRAKHESYNF
jgi:hypothetical protein